MLTPRSEALAFHTLEEALSTNEGRVALFRQLAAYDEAGDYETWCQRWGHDPNDSDVEAHWSNLHNTYVVAWKELDELFTKYLLFAKLGLRLRSDA